MSALPMHPGGCAVTIAEALGGAVLAKRWNADGTATPYGNAFLYDLHHWPVANLAALADVLRDLLTAPRCCILRGAPVVGERMDRVRRLLHPDAETGAAPTLREVARRWVAVDLDSVPLPDGTDPRDLAACAGAVRRYLPNAFRDAAAIVQATAGHGIKPGARLRWWAWLSRPVPGAELLEWFKGCPVDVVTFRAAQPIYTAAPLFAPGIADPLPERLALVQGARDVVSVPPSAMLRPVRFVWPVQPRRASNGDGAGRFAALVRTVRDSAEGERHYRLFWAACRAGEMVAAGAIGAESAAAELARAAMEAGGRDARNAEATARDGIKRGIAAGGAA